ncbi:MAG: glycosyltransferase family 39 protein [Clostridiales bacterium]|nr:glycosyltransferase family 39 protein [Clostridiales bacterium]
MYQDIITIAVVTVIAFYALYRMWFQGEVDGSRLIAKQSMAPQKVNIIILLVAAFIIKTILAVRNEGYSVDISCFRAWSETVFTGGISHFYEGDVTDYPPGYMLVLWLVGALRHLFDIDINSTTGLFMIKLFPMLFDLAAAYLIYIMAKKRFSEGMSLMLSALYALNPAVVIDSSVWGQVDGVLCCMVLLTCYLFMEEKRILAYFSFCAGVLLKPQMVMFAPIIIYSIIEQVFLKDCNKQKVIRDLLGGIASLVAMVLVALPFGLEKSLEKYTGTLGMFEYCTVNAYNFWAIIGKNWHAQTEKFLFIPAQTWGNIAIIAAVVLSAIVFFKMKKDKSKYFLSMAVVISVMFCFSVRMHERYLFPAVALLLAAFILRPCKELFYAFIGYTLVVFLNTAHVYYTAVELNTTGPTGYIIGAIAVLTLFLFGYLLYIIFKKSEIVQEANVDMGGKSRKKKYQPQQKQPEKRFDFKIIPTVVMEKMTRTDFIILFSIMLVYGIFALRDLGYASAPENGWEGTQAGQQIVLDFGETKELKELEIFSGSYENRSLHMELSTDGTNYVNGGTAKISDVFKWNNVKLMADGNSEEEKKDFQATARYIRFTTVEDLVTIKEMLFKDAAGNVVVPVNKDQYPELFDEQDKYDEAHTFRSGTYFDEIYHARTAYEMIHGLYNYENTHPPLGKFFISLGVRIFGMNPFGWRIIGTLFGIGMLPFMYLFGKRLFHQTWVAGVVTALFAFDFMHFTQTRIATIDVYGTFFIMAMFYFMLRYAQTSFYDTEFKKTLIPLGLSGLMMGLGCASKWTAVYAAAGLAVFFAAIMGYRYMEYRKACNNPGGSTEGISHKHVMEVFQSNFIKTIGACVIFFIVIPGLIYLLSYVPFSDGTDNGLWARMIENQKSMYRYHSQLEATHPYSSTWYEWPTMIRPVFYYSNTLANGLHEGISAFGNPLVWWAGIFAFIYMIYRCIKKVDKVAIFLVFSYLVQYIPWILVPRCTFAYHYFPSVPFVALMVGYSLYCFIGDNKKKRIFAYAYVVAAVALFLLFYPVLSGQPVSLEYVENGLKWLTGWVLVL